MVMIRHIQVKIHTLFLNLLSNQTLAAELAAKAWFDRRFKNHQLGVQAYNQSAWLLMTFCPCFLLFLHCAFQHITKSKLMYPVLASYFTECMPFSVVACNCIAKDRGYSVFALGSYPISLVTELGVNVQYRSRVLFVTCQPIFSPF